MKKIISDTARALGELTVETGKEAVKQAGEMGRTVATTITGSDLLGDMVKMSDGEMSQKKEQDEAVKNEEMERLRRQMQTGRNVERELEELRQEREIEEKKKEEVFLENIRVQREEEEEERQRMLAQQESSSPSKRKKKRGSAFARGKQGQASLSEMSATSEFPKKSDQ